MAINKVCDIAVLGGCNPKKLWSKRVCISLLFTVFMGIYGALCTAKLLKRQKEEIRRLSDREYLRRQYYEEIVTYKAQLRRLHHDIRNQLIIADKLQNEKSRNQYVESLDRYFREISAKVNTGNEILDVLIQNKLRICKEKDIVFEYDIDFRDGGFIEFVDVGIIFGNMVDNAIESCERIGKPGQKMRLTVHTYEKFLYINMENPVKEYKEKNGRLLTLKKDKNTHGIGMESIKAALKKYKGSYQYQVEEGKFKFTILIPINA